MKALIFSSKKEAVAYRDEAAAKLGYPKQGTQIGGGRHVAPELARTLYPVEIVAHPKIKQWAVPVSEEVESDVEAKAEVDALAVSVARADWEPERPK